MSFTLTRAIVALNASNASHSARTQLVRMASTCEGVTLARAEATQVWCVWREEFTKRAIGVCGLTSEMSHPLFEWGRRSTRAKKMVPPALSAARHRSCGREGQCASERGCQRRTWRQWLESSSEVREVLRMGRGGEGDGARERGETEGAVNGYKDKERGRRSRKLNISTLKERTVL
eukprot:419639-Pleurochrysis_carterae.AAC.1